LVGRQYPEAAISEGNVHAFPLVFLVQGGKCESFSNVYGCNRTTKSVSFVNLPRRRYEELNKMPIVHNYYVCIVQIYRAGNITVIARPLILYV